MRIAGFSLLVVLSSALVAHADEVQLSSGASIEGKAKREGETVVIRVESGEIRVPADTVKQIRKAESSEEIVARRRASLAPHDVRGRIELAAFCREHELRATERALLQEVLDIDPNQPQARRSLGYERDASGRWVDRSHELQAARAAEEAARLERLRAEASAALERERERQQREARDEALLARDEAVRARDEALRASQDAYLWYPGYYGALVYSQVPHHAWQTPRCPPGRSCNAPPVPAFPIAGVRHPRDTSFFLPGVKDPRESLR